VPDYEIRVAGGALAKFVEKLSNPERLLARIGIVLLRESQKAFERQSFGAIRWARRYPNQTEPIVNYAGAVADLEKGPRVKPRRFEARPSAMDTGALRASLSPARGILGKGAFSITIGSTLPYAQIQHGGGETRVPVTAQVKRNLGLFLRGSKRKAARAGKEAAMLKAALRKKVAAGRMSMPEAKAEFRRKAKVLKAEIAAAGKLVFLFHVNELTTKVNARPFVGVTDTAKADIDVEIARFLGGK
jgi:phage gpG-like protein